MLVDDLHSLVAKSITCVSVFFGERIQRGQNLILSRLIENSTIKKSSTDQKVVDGSISFVLKFATDGRQMQLKPFRRGTDEANNKKEATVQIKKSVTSRDTPKRSVEIALRHERG